MANKQNDDKWDNERSQELFKALLELKTTAEVAAFCRDLMTEDEIAQFADRWAAAQALNGGKSQRATSAETGVSIATVTRVSQWLNSGKGGYKLVLERLAKKQRRK